MVESNAIKYCCKGIYDKIYNLIEFGKQLISVKSNQKAYHVKNEEKTKRYDRGPRGHEAIEVCDDHRHTNHTLSKD